MICQAFHPSRVQCSAPNNAKWVLRDCLHRQDGERGVVMCGAMKKHTDDRSAHYDRRLGNCDLCRERQVDCRQVTLLSELVLPTQSVEDL